MPKSNTNLTNSLNPEKPKKERKEWRNPEGSVYRKEITRRAANGKEKKEYVWEARKRYQKPLFNEFGQPVLDESGKQILELKEKKRRADTQAEALVELGKIRAEIEKELTEHLQAAESKQNPANKTVSDLLDYFSAEFIKPAEYIDNEKVGGYRESLAAIRNDVSDFRSFFGDKPLHLLNYEDLRRYKEHLKAKPVIKIINVKHPLTDDERKELNVSRRVKQRIEKKEVTTTRKIASVHRRLARLRHILNIGVRLRWLPNNPFLDGEPLINKSLETRRQRMMTYEEEEIFLREATGKREHIADIIICAVDGFMRQGEMQKLVGRDVDFDKGYLTVQKTNSKTVKERIVPLTPDMREVLLKLKERSEDWDNSPVFPVKSIKKAFSTIKKEHGITDLRLHDLRGTGITRMLESGEARHVVKQISGHDTDAAFQHYERKNVESIINAAARLAAHNAKKRKLPLKDAPKPDEKDVTDAEKAA